MDGGNGIGLTLQENHGKAVFRRENLGRGGADHTPPGIGHAPGQRVHKRRLAPGPHKRGHPGKGRAAGSGEQGFKRPPLHGYPSRERFFRWISRQVSAAGVTPEMRPA